MNHNPDASNTSVPFCPLLIGSGKLQKHLSHYFHLIGLSHHHYQSPRKLTSTNALLPADFVEISKKCTHFWILTSDQAIPEIHSRLSVQFSHHEFIHSSGALALPGALCLHPLMTFGPELYARETYESIPFIAFQEESIPFRSTLKGFHSKISNPFYFLPDENRVQYHLACVMLSNFPILLWEAGLNSVSGMTLDRKAFQPILEQTLSNFMKSGKSALTGPLSRNDFATLKKHEDLIRDTPERILYRAFIEYFHESKSEIGINHVNRT